jgi:hypothetical protein
MRVLVACKRGNIAKRDRFGHCLCDDCKKYRYEKQMANPSRLTRIRIWRQKNKDKVCEYSKKWINNNKEKRRQIEISWRIKNPKKVKEMNARGGKKWASNNKGKRNAIDMRRKAALIQRTPLWADLEKIESFYVEAEKLTKETGIKYEVDHIIPLQGKTISGLHVHNNLQILTRSENRSKKNNVKQIIWENFVY